MALLLGTIPHWLSGRLIRNGPGIFEIGDTKYNHLFDGLSLLHSFTIDQGQYSTHFLNFHVINLRDYVQEGFGIKAVS